MDDVAMPDPAALAALVASRPLLAAARFVPPGARARAESKWRNDAHGAARSSRRRQTARAKLMLRLGFMVTKERSLLGLSPLHAAVASGPRGEAALDTMLAAIATLPLNARPFRVRDWGGLTLLAYAVQANWGDGVRKLVAAGFDISAPYADKPIDEWKEMPGTGASLLSFAAALGHMEAFQALIECGADVSKWDRNGMRAVHIAAMCGNLPAVRDLMALDGGLGELSKKQVIELYTVREKFEKGPMISMQRADEDGNGDSEPLGDEGPGASMQMDMLDDVDEGNPGESNSGWGAFADGDPSHSRDFYRMVTSELDDFDLENLGNADDGDATTDGPGDTLFTDDGDGDDDEDDNENIVGSDDDEDDIPELLEPEDLEDSAETASEAKVDKEDAVFVNALLAALDGALAPALAKADKIRKSFKVESDDSNGGGQTASGENSGTPDASSASTRPQQGEAHFVTSEGETHIYRMGDVVRVSHVPGVDGEMGDEDQAHIRMVLLSHILKALDMSRKVFYGATLLHLAVKRRHHNVLRFLLESSPCAQSIDERMNDGLTALHIAAEDNDAVAVKLLISAGANLNCRSDTDSTTPLMRAAKLGNTDSINVLVAHGASISDEDDEGCSVLHYAAEAENGVEIVEKFARAGAKINGQAADGSTPVYAAVARGSTEVFKKLLQLGGDPSIANYDGSVPLGFIANKGMEELASFAEFVANNPVIKEKMDMDVTIRDQGMTALHMAADEGSPVAIRRLLEAGSDCNKLNEYGLSALVLISRAEDVTMEDRFECMRLLVEAGANVKLAAEEGKQALHFVTFLGEAECVELLLKKGADPSAPTKQKTPLHLVALENFPDIAELLVKYGGNLNAVDEIGMTPLMYAALRHSTLVLKVLIDAGANMAHRAEAGMTALHISGVTNHPDAEETVRLLCEAGAPMDVKDDQGMYPIHLHGDFGRTRCVRRMLMNGCDPDMRCGAGFTPLIRACNARDGERSLRHDNLPLVRVLLRAGADVNAKNDNDNTVMSYLGDTNEHELIRVMLAAGADINVADKQGDTPLHEAAMGNHPRTVALLARRGANVNAQNEKSETALFIAAVNGFDDVVKALLAKGLSTNISLPNSAGVTPYQAARDKGNDAIASMLLDAMGLRLSQFAPLTTYTVKSPRHSVDGVDGFRRHDSGRLLCVTCQEGLHFGEEIRELPCGHYFHDPCILPWLGGEKMTNNRTCPVCKQLVAPTELFPSPI